MKSYINKTSLKGLQASKNKALILDIQGGIFHFNQIWGIVSKNDRTHKRLFSCRVTFSRWTEKSINKVILAPHFITYFMFILSSSECRNILSCICVCAYIDIYIKHIFVYGRVCQKAQGWQKPVTRQMKRQSDPAVALAAAEPQWEERPVCAGGWRALPGPGPSPSPHHTARGALGDTRVRRGGQSHPDISVTSGVLDTFFACLSSPNSSCTCSNGW